MIRTFAWRCQYSTIIASWLGSNVLDGVTRVAMILRTRLDSNITGANLIGAQSKKPADLNLYSVRQGDHRYLKQPKPSDSKYYDLQFLEILERCPTTRSTAKIKPNNISDRSGEKYMN